MWITGSHNSSWRKDNNKQLVVVFWTKQTKLELLNIIKVRTRSRSYRGAVSGQLELGKGSLDWTREEDGAENVEPERLMHPGTRSNGLTLLEPQVQSISGRSSKRYQTRFFLTGKTKGLLKMTG
jgi:hypothetical protein